MDKKKLTTNEYEKPFPTRLRMLLAEKNMTQTDLADAFKNSGLKVTRQTISSYANGETVPDIMRFKFIADFFDVPYDYLLGASPTRERKNVQIGAELGLEDAAINELKRYNDSANRGFPPDMYRLMAMNQLIADSRSYDFFWNVVSYVSYKNGYKEKIKKLLEDEREDIKTAMGVSYMDIVKEQIQYREWIMVESIRKFAMDFAEKVSQFCYDSCLPIEELEEEI